MHFTDKFFASIFRCSQPAIPVTLGNMTAGGTQTRLGTTPPGDGGHGSPAPPGFLPAPPPSPPPAQQIPPGYWSRPRRFRGVLAAVGIVLAIALGAAALVVSLMNADREPAAQPATSPTQQVSTTDADRNLCQAIAPLMRETADRGKAFVNLGHTGIPERDAGIPAFVADKNNWAERAQSVLDAHALPPRYLSRMLQRFVDDRRAYAASIQPGPATDADGAAWNDSLVAASGPYQVCGDLGIPLW